MNQDRFDVFVGLDVGKEHHHATALNTAGKRLHDKVLPQDESALQEVFAKLAGYGSVLVIVDQPATIGALPVTVARAMGIEVAYLPGLAMRRIADLHPARWASVTRLPRQSPSARSRPRISPCRAPGLGTQARSASSQPVTNCHASVAVSGSAVDRGWVTMRWKASRDAQGSPTGSTPFKAFSNHDRAAPWKWDRLSTA